MNKKHHIFLAALLLVFSTPATGNWMRPYAIGFSTGILCSLFTASSLEDPTIYKYSPNLHTFSMALILLISPGLTVIITEAFSMLTQDSTTSNKQEKRDRSNTYAVGLTTLFIASIAALLLCEPFTKMPGYSQRANQFYCAAGGSTLIFSGAALTGVLLRNKFPIL